MPIYVPKPRKVVSVPFNLHNSSPPTNPVNHEAAAYMLEYKRLEKENDADILKCQALRDSGRTTDALKVMVAVLEKSSKINDITTCIYNSNKAFYEKNKGLQPNAKGDKNTMPIFMPKERKAHYSGVANGTIPTKPDSQFTPDEQISYARGQRDARNEAAMGYLLGKNSPLTPLEKAKLKAENKLKRAAYKANPSPAPKFAKAKK